MLTIKKKRSTKYIGTVEDNDTMEMIRKLVKEANKFFSEKPYRYSLRQKNSDFYLYRKAKCSVGKEENGKKENR